MRVVPALDPPPVLQPWSLEACGVKLLSLGDGISNAAFGPAWPAANYIVYVPFSLQKPAQPTGFFYLPAGAAVDIDVGVYDHTGVRLARTGIVTSPASGQPQYVPIAVPVLGVGRGYLAFWKATATAIGGRAFSGSLGCLSWLGLLEEAGGAGGLPAQATFATFSQTRIPMCGLVFDDRVFV